MANLDFNGDVPYALTTGNWVSSPAEKALHWDNVDLLQALDRVQFEFVDGEIWLRHEVRAGDISNGVTDRNELYVNSAGRNLYGPGDEFWWGESFIVPSSTTDLASWLLLTQLHGNESGSPEWAVELTGEKIILTVRGGNIAQGGDTNWPRLNSYVANASVPRDVRFDLKAYTKLATDGTGINKLWFRLHSEAWPTSPQVNVVGPNVVSLAGTPLTLPAPRVSLYRDRRTETTVVHRTGPRVRRTEAAIDAFFDQPGTLTAEQLASAPVGLWTLQETTGQFADLAGNHPATLVGAATRGTASLRSDNEDAAVTLGGNQYIAVGDLRLGELDACTYECLVETVSNGGRALISEGRSDSANPRVEMEINFTSPGVSYVDNSGAALTFSPSALGTRTIPTGRKHLMQMRFSKSGQVMELFVNGERQGGPTFTSPGAISLDSLTIGGRSGNGTVSRHGGSVKLQNVAVYDRALTDREIQMHWNAATAQNPLRPITGSLPRLVKLAGTPVLLPV